MKNVYNRARNKSNAQSRSPVIIVVSFPNAPLMRPQTLETNVLIPPIDPAKHIVSRRVSQSRKGLSS